MLWHHFLRTRSLRSTPTSATALLAPQFGSHIPALDAIRGLAILMVTFYRFGGATEGAAQAVNTSWILGVGTRGVDLFFVLSGFLITGILSDARGKDHFFRNFYVRRALRIFPLYYGVLIAVAVGSQLSSTFASMFSAGMEHQAWLWLYGTNILQSLRGEWCLGPMDHFWSLAVEEHFYCVWPLVIFCCSRRTAMRICGYMVAFSMVGRVAWVVVGGNAVAIDALTPFRMDGLAIGSWVALAARGEKCFEKVVYFTKPAAVGTGAVVFLLWLIDRRLMGLPHTVWSVFFASLLVALLTTPRGSWLERLGQSRTLRFFGKYSYAMYVFQYPLIPIMAGVIAAPRLAELIGNAWVAQALYCGLMFLLTTGLAVVSWNCWEKQFLLLKAYFTELPKPCRQTAAEASSH